MASIVRWELLQFGNTISPGRKNNSPPFIGFDGGGGGGGGMI